jgi:hypothetical protein
LKITSSDSHISKITLAVITRTIRVIGVTSSIEEYLRWTNELALAIQANWGGLFSTESKKKEIDKDETSSED